nr:hypothetical protein [uncultured Prevotella sp.]
MVHRLAGCRECAVASAEQVFVCLSVPEDEAADIVGTVHGECIGCCQSQGVANRYGDIVHCRTVDGTQLLPRGGIDVLRHVAVGKLYSSWLVHIVIFYHRYSLVGI